MFSLESFKKKNLSTEKQSCIQVQYSKRLESTNQMLNELRIFFLEW